MIYKEYGKTGLKLSAVGFGGMRFEDELVQAGRFGECAELVLYAHGKGINYIDTAPFYNGDKSEEIFGVALAQIPRDEIYVSTKANFGTCLGEPSRDSFRRRLELSLERLKVDYIDFYHHWWFLNIEGYRKEVDGLYKFFEEVKSEGLIKHIAFSSHMMNEDLISVVDDGLYEGVLLGYNALNHRFRVSGVEAAYNAGMGVTVMNPVAGGIIPQNPETFAYLAEGTEYSVAGAALRFVMSHKEVTVALNGFNNTNEVDEAVRMTENLEIKPAKNVIAGLKEGVSLDNLCTVCGYCGECPRGVPIVKYMDAYNQKLLGRDIGNWLRWHWNIYNDKAKDCNGCGQCEARCTQHLPIIERLAEIGELQGVPTPAE